MILKGNEIFILNSDGSKAIVASNSCTIEVAADVAEVSSPTTGAWKAYKVKRKSWKITLSHFVWSLQFPANLLKVGTQVQVKLSTGLPFDGMVENITPVDQMLIQPPTKIYWDADHYIFVGLKNDTYYKGWYGGTDYNTPKQNSTFTYAGEVFAYVVDYLISVGKIAGAGIVTQANIVANVNSLAKGQLTILGNGSIN